MRYFIIFLVFLASFPAWAQQPAPDPRISGFLVQAQQAEIALRDAALKAIQEDAQKKEQQWEEWFKAYCGDQPGCAAMKGNKP